MVPVLLHPGYFTFETIRLSTIQAWYHQLKSIDVIGQTQLRHLSLLGYFQPCI
ncbi:MAG: hypothetical protein GY784_14705 [Gammaproteobacteria bacterium]|nr:hypothetical protein [Gammaproteobacteria bacterium]